MKRNRTLNGYVVVYRPDHPKAMVGGNWDGYVYEHIAVAEKSQDTVVLDDELVHHLDENRANNSPDNLLIMRESSHVKLHAWLSKNIVVAKPSYALRKMQGCIRCKICEEPINSGEIYCSVLCSGKARRKTDRPDITVLSKDISTMSMVATGKKYGVSDNAVRKWCVSLGIDLTTLKPTSK